MKDEKPLTAIRPFADGAREECLTNTPVCAGLPARPFYGLSEAVCSEKDGSVNGHVRDGNAHSRCSCQPGFVGSVQDVWSDRKVGRGREAGDADCGYQEPSPEHQAG